MNTSQAYIAIEGVIGVGKTTLARMFQRETGGQLVLEVFEENPFLSNFYADRARYAFQTQIFFLLSRYHQQRQFVHLPRPLISDYMFDKDRLFAQVNLEGDELVTYYSVQEALAENICRPDLVVFLKADTSTLMNRITARDRPYERNMDPLYIDHLRVAYDQFFGDYQAAPVLTVDTNEIDFVQDPDQRETIFNRIRSGLGQGPLQPSLPGLETITPPPAPSALEKPSVSDQTAHRLSDFQQYHRELDRDNALSADPYFNFIRLQEEIGDLARAFARQWVASTTGRQDNATVTVREELADVLAYVLRLANTAGIDLEAAYLEKLRTNTGHSWSLSFDSKGEET